MPLPNAVFDAIVIGAGVNGLVAAHTLARKGRKVVVLEQRAAAPAEPVYGWIPPDVLHALPLKKHGLKVEPLEPWAGLVLEDGGRLDLGQDMLASMRAIQRISPKDAEAWPSFCKRMRRLASVLEELYVHPAPDLETTDRRELLRLGLLGLKVRRRGRQATIDLLRVLPMAVGDLLDEWFETDALKAALAIEGVRHMFQGPRGGGTAFAMLHHHTGCRAGVFRQPRSNIQAALDALRGVEVRRETRVARITVKEGSATGVVLANGEELAAPLVLSTADPRTTLLGLLEPGWLDPEFGRAVRNIKCRGVAARVTLLVSQPAPFKTLTLAGSLAYLEHAYDDAKYGRLSTNPLLEAHATEGRVDVHVQYVPHAPRHEGWSDRVRQELAEMVVRRLGEAAPGLAETVTEAKLEAPPDLERDYGLTGGHAYQGELTLDQVLFMRPVPGWSRYLTPIGGLLLAGSGSHPGGAVLGGAGLLAARAALAT